MSKEIKHVFSIVHLKINSLIKCFPSFMKENEKQYQRYLLFTAGKKIPKNLISIREECSIFTRIFVPNIAICQHGHAYKFDYAITEDN